MAASIHPERKHRRTVLVLTLACAVTWLFAIGHAVTPGAIGAQSAAADVACQTAELSCMRAAAPAYTPASAPGTVQTVPVSTTTVSPAALTP